MGSRLRRGRDADGPRRTSRGGRGFASDESASFAATLPSEYPRGTPRRGRDPPHRDRKKVTRTFCRDRRAPQVPRPSGDACPFVLILLCTSRGRRTQSNAARMSSNGARTAEMGSGAGTLARRDAQRQARAELGQDAALRGGAPGRGRRARDRARGRRGARGRAAPVPAAACESKRAAAPPRMWRRVYPSPRALRLGIIHAAPRGGAATRPRPRQKTSPPSCRTFRGDEHHAAGTT